MCIAVCLGLFFFFSSRRRHTRYIGDWSSDVCSSDLGGMYDIERTGKEVEWLPGEKPISDMLLGPGHPITIGKEYTPGVQRTRELCERMLALHFGEKFFSRNLGSFITGVVIAVVFSILGLILDTPAAVLVALAAAMALT